MKYRMKAEKTFVILPGVGRLRPGQLLEGPQWERFVALGLLERVPELDRVATPHAAKRLPKPKRPPASPPAAKRPPATPPPSRRRAPQEEQAPKKPAPPPAPEPRMPPPRTKVKTKAKSRAKTRARSVNKEKLPPKQRAKSSPKEKS